MPKYLTNKKVFLRNTLWFSQGLGNTFTPEERGTIMTDKYLSTAFCIM